MNVRDVFQLPTTKFWRVYASITLSILGLMTCATTTSAGVVYSGISAPYAKFASTTGSFGTDDYATNLLTPTMNLDSVKFVGGVTVANSIVQLLFEDTSGNPVNGFQVNLTVAGDFLWTIILPSNFVIPTAGRLQIAGVNGAVGEWALTSTAPTVGSNDFSFTLGPNGLQQPTSTPRNFAFELSGTAIEPPNSVPEPGSMVVWSLAATVFAVGGIRSRLNRSTVS